MTIINPFHQPQIRKIEITPMQDGLSLTWKCPSCGILNELLKTQIGNNKLYPCSNDCTYEWVLGILPDDMRHWLQDDIQDNVNKRPRIVKI